MLADIRFARNSPGGSHPIARHVNCSASSGLRRYAKLLAANNLGPNQTREGTSVQEVPLHTVLQGVHAIAWYAVNSDDLHVVDEDGAGITAPEGIWGR